MTTRGTVVLLGMHAPEPYQTANLDKLTMQHLVDARVKAAPV